MSSGIDGAGLATRLLGGVTALVGLDTLVEAGVLGPTGTALESAVAVGTVVVGLSLVAVAPTPTEVVLAVTHALVGADARPLEASETGATRTETADGGDVEAGDPDDEG